MNTKLFGAAVAAVLLCSSAPRILAQYNASVVNYDSHAYPDSDNITLTGSIVRVNADGDRLIVRTDRDRRFLVDAYSAEVVSPGNVSQSSHDLQSGDRVRVVGRLLGVRFVEAGRVVLLGDGDDDSGAIAMAPPITLAPDDTPSPVVVPAPVTPAGPTVTIDAVVTSIVTEEDQLFIIDDNDKVYRVKADNADIIIPGVDRAGTLADLSKGERIKVIGETDSNGSIILADRIRVEGAPDEPAPAPVPAPVAQPVDLSSYTGILIDVRDMEAIQRSPNPAVYDADMNEIYPDRSHVPTPDEVQNESTVRYYRTIDDAKAGVCGSNPLIINAEMVVGPADDGVLVGAADAKLFKDLDKLIGFSKNWKVGFLIPSDR